MGLLSIYDKLRDEGMSDIGARAMIGNMEAESLLLPNNLENRCNKLWAISDEEYVRRVNADEPTHGSSFFWNDAAGFGLYQLTEASRKLGYYRTARELWGVSIDDEECQCWYCCHEMRTFYQELWAYVCNDKANLATAVNRICTEFERPKVNNSSWRYKCAIARGAELDELLQARTIKADAALTAKALDYASLAARFAALSQEFEELAKTFKANI